MRCFILAAGLLAAPAFAQTTPAAAPASLDARATAMIGQLETFRDKETFKLVDKVRAFTFKAVDEKPFDFILDPAKTYRVLSLCDEHCDGVDLAAEDANEADVGRDFGQDPVAWVDLKPGAAGSKLTATVFPGACKQGECLVAVALFEVLKPRP